MLRLNIANTEWPEEEWQYEIEIEDFHQSIVCLFAESTAEITNIKRSF